MTPSDSIALKVFTRPVRFALFGLRSIWAAIVLVGVCVLWLLLFALFLPFLLVSELLGWSANRIAKAPPADAASGEVASLFASKSAGNTQFIFDRRLDVSKLYGCNTRNVQYQWAIFSQRLAAIKKEFQEPRALDFGAGSLRDSFELSKLGFQVVSLDLDENLMQQYHNSYPWEELSVTPRLFTNTLDDLLQQTGANRFHLVIAFDVIEHLEDPAAVVGGIRSLLHEKGLLFTIVPNRRNIFERYFKYDITRRRERGIPWVQGVPHLQFKSPAEWEEFFEDNGFKVLEHDMEIGFLVNNCWCGLLGLPIRIWVCPVLAMLAHVFRFRFDGVAFERAFSPAWLMERVNTWDIRLKKYLRNSFGWNLIVCAKES